MEDSQEYLDAVVEHSKATVRYYAVHMGYRAWKVTEHEYSTAQEEYQEACRAFDRTWQVEAQRMHVSPLAFVE